MKYAIQETILVEGKYDLNKIKSLFTSPVLTTNGFGIFKDEQLIKYLRRLSESCGIVVLTDGDASGNKIRNVIKSRVSGKVYHAYIPDIYGKEKRKRFASAEGKLGVEAMSSEIILEAVKKSGAHFLDQTTPYISSAPITRADFYQVGLIGAENSQALRSRFLAELSLPERMNVTSILETINLFLPRDDFFNMIDALFFK